MNCTTTNKLLLTRFLPFLVLLTGLGSGAGAQTISIVSGNGQLVNAPSFLSTSPMVLQVTSAAGKPLAGVPITWAITSGAGTLPDAETATDSNGEASSHFTSTTLQPELSSLDSTITATSKYGTVTFHAIAIPYLNNGSPVTPPSIVLVKPAIGATLTASPGSTLPGAVQVMVLAGYGAEANQPIPNVSIQLVNGNDPTMAASAMCSGSGGVIYTNASGSATCNLVVTGQPGLSVLRANAGGVYSSPFFELQINPGAPCTYTISPTANSVNTAGGTGIVKVTTASACGWAATSNVTWISITSGASGTGNGTVDYSVGADTTGARTGTLTIAGQTFTVTQSSTGGGALTITSPATLPSGTANQSYSTTLAASGGAPPYTWSIASGTLPAGLMLNASTGLISGAPTAAGTVSFTVGVKDTTGATATLLVSITIASSSSKFVITNASFPNGVIGETYVQTITSSGGVVSPFFPSPSFQITGGALPAGLKLVRNQDLSTSITGVPTTAGVSAFTLTAMDAAGDTASANFTITVTGTLTSEQLMVNPASISFTVQLGSTNIPAPQTLAITGNGGVLAYTSVVTTQTGGNWLVAQNATAGNTPGSLTLGITNYSSLAPGNYTGTVAVSAAAIDSPVIVPVTLTVIAAPSLTVAPQQLSVSQGQTSGSNVTMESIQVATGSSAGGTTAINFSTSVVTKSGGNWLSVSPSTGSTPATLAVSINSGGLAIGTYTGTISIIPSSGSQVSVAVTLNVINPETLSASPAPVAFTYVQGAASPEAQTVTVSGSTGPALSLSTAVATTDQGNWLFVNPSGGTTPLALSVSVNPSGLTPNTYKGTITVTATDDSVTPLAIPVTLTVVPPGPNIASVVNAASFAPGPVAPGEFVTIFGTGLGPTTPVGAMVNSGMVSTNIGQTLVFFDNYFAPILYTSATQVSVIVPYELTGASSTKLTVWYQGTSSADYDLRVIAAVPGIFTLNTAGQGAIVNQDGTINSSTNGAPAGSVVSIYATGQGQTNPPGADGQLATAASQQPPPLPVTVQMGGLPATVTYAGAAPGEPDGFMQVNVTVPSGLAPGTAVPVVMTVGTAPSQAGVTIFIHP